MQIFPGLGRTAEASQPSTDLIVARIALNPAAPKTGQIADIVVFVQNVSSASISLSGFTAGVAVGSTTLTTNAYTGTLNTNGVIELKYTGYTVTEGSNIFTVSISGGRSLTYEYNTRGAHLGYVEYEAEDGYYNGQLIVPTVFRHGDLASEARGGKAVMLTERGQFVQWVAAEDANALTIRADIPEGAPQTISLYVNGVFKEKITLNSTRLYNLAGYTKRPDIVDYFKTSGMNEKLNYRESHKLLTTPINKGDVVRLQIDANDRADYYCIDFIELEYALKKEKPVNLVSIADYGAVEGGKVDNTDAIQNAINAAIREGTAGIWFPEGNWGLMNVIYIDILHLDIPEGFVFAGAGIWYTRLNRIINPEPPNEFWYFGFMILGATVTFQDFMIDGIIEDSEHILELHGSGITGSTFGANSRIENLWIQGTAAGITAGLWWEDYLSLPPEQAQSRGTLIQNVRIRETTDNGLNLHRGRVGVTVRNVNSRSTGDDGFAMWSHATGSSNPGIGNQGNIIQNCTAELQRWGQGIMLYGGRDNQYLDIVVRDHNFGMPGIIVSMWSGWDNDNLTGDNRFERITIDRCGWASDAYAGDDSPIWASIWVYGADRDIRSVNFKDIDIRNADYTAVKIMGDIEVSFENLNIDGYCLGTNATHLEGAAVVYGGATGKVYWKNRSISGGGNNRPEEIKIWGSDNLEIIHLTADQPIPMPSAYPTPSLPPAPNINSAAGCAHANINNAFRKGFIPAEIVNNYRNVITRSEFCRMAVMYLEYATGKGIDVILAENGVSRDPNAFTDTSDPYILAAYALRITTGTGSGRFTPNGSITRQQAATMLMRACRVLGMDVENAPPSGFADIDRAANWAVDAINFCRANGIMQGVSSTNFAPLSTFTRQESIATFDRMG